MLCELHAAYGPQWVRFMAITGKSRTANRYRWLSLKARAAELAAPPSAFPDGMVPPLPPRLASMNKQNTQNASVAHAARPRCPLPDCAAETKTLGAYNAHGQSALPQYRYRCVACAHTFHTARHTLTVAEREHILATAPPPDPAAARAEGASRRKAHAKERPERLTSLRAWMAARAQQPDVAQALADNGYRLSTAGQKAWAEEYRAGSADETIEFTHVRTQWRTLREELQAALVSEEEPSALSLAGRLALAVPLALAALADGEPDHPRLL